MNYLQVFFLSMSRPTAMEGNGSCTNITSEDAKATTDASIKIITASFAMLFYLVVLVLSALGALFSWWNKLLSMRATYVLFLVGALMVSVNIFTTENDFLTGEYYRIASGSLVGIIYLIVGGIAFFKKPPSCTAVCRPVANRPCIQHRHDNTPTLARQHPSMGLVVGAITLSLVSIEVMLLIAGYHATRKPQQSGVCPDVRMITYLVQKTVQVVMYVWLRYRIPSPRFRESASFYFKILSFFNFVMWLSDMVSIDYLLLEFGGGSGSVFNGVTVRSIYKALLIDYRLLCSLLFLEHALEIQETDNRTANGAENNTETQGRPQDRPPDPPVRAELLNSDQCVIIDDLTPSDRQKRNMGYLVGLSCFLVQVVCLANYLPKLHVGPWVHVFAILVYTFLAICGVIMLNKNNLEIRHTLDRESSGIQIMVCCMGAVGLTCWIIQAALVAFWSAMGSRGDVTDEPYFGWAAAKLSVRAIGTLFLVVVFAKVDAPVIAKRNPTVKINHFLVPVMMLGILSEFVGTVIDQHSGPVKRQIRCEVTESSLKLLFEVGPAIYLGFCIHLFLHFLVMQCQMGKTRVALDNSGNQATETSPLLGFLRGRTRTRKPNRTV